MSSRAPFGPAVAQDLEETIRSFSRVLDELRRAHATLSARAERVEADLCRANAELEARVAELEAVLQNLPTGVVVRDVDGRIARANPRALEILGVEADALVGSSDCPGLAGERAGAEPRELARDDGQVLLVAGRYAEIRLDDGRRLGSVEILDDRSQVEAMRARVHRLDKMAALGTMAGGIAHEIRNPLNGARGFAALLAERVEEGSAEGRWARRIIEAVDECNGIVSSMLTLADPERLTLETIDAREWVEETLELCRRDARPELSLSAQVEPLRFVGDRLKLRQALRNLVANAIEAQAGKGAVRVALAREVGGVCVRVQDAGPGIPPALVERVTDPFFTTRAEGTGLGLALVHTIAQLHGGALEIGRRPSPLGGAEVRLRFPEHPMTQPPPSSQHPVRRPATRS